MRKDTSMWYRIKTWFAPPFFKDDQEKQRIATLLNIILWIELGLVLASVPLLFFTKAFLGGLIAISGLILLVVVMLFVLRAGRVRLSGILFLWSLWLIATALVFTSGGVAHQAPSSYFVVILVAGLILGGKSVAAVAVSSSIVCIALVVANQMNIEIPAPIASSFLFDVSMLVTNLVMVASLLYLATRSLREALLRARQYAVDIEAQKEQVQTLFDQRTDELTRREAYLGATTAIASEASAVERDPQELLDRVTIVISEQFGFYHTGIFMIDSGRVWAELRASSSEGGARMIVRGHRRHLGEGMVGDVAQSGRYRLAQDVRQDTAFRENPDLPETRAEIALPLRVRGEVIGVLDVQSIEPDAFSDEDVTVLQALADQVAMAVNSARLLRQVEERAEAERRAYGELAREAWQELLRARPDLAFASDASGVVPFEAWEPQMKTAARTGQVVGGNDAPNMVAIPLRVREQVIGVIDGRKPDGTAWTQDEIDLLQTLTEQLSTALEGAQLYEDTQRRAAREQLAREITDRMRSTVSWDELMQTAIQQMADAVGVSRSFVQWVTPEAVTPAAVTPSESEEEGVPHA